MERRSGWKITPQSCYQNAVRTTKKHAIRRFGLKCVTMMLLVPVPCKRRVWVLSFLTALYWPAERHGGQQHKTSVDWVRQMTQEACR